MKRFALPHAFLLLLFLAVTAYSGEPKEIDPMTLSQKDFFRIVRHVPGQETWAKMSGTAQHKREGARRIKAPITLAIRFTPARIVAKMFFDKKEVYNLGQSFDPPISTVESNLKNGEQSRLGFYGIDAGDLTLSFIYQDVIREEKPDRVSIFPCRVFMLKGTSEGETARVYISTEYFFPIRVQWFSKDPGKNNKGTPYRELEIGSVKKAPDSDFYLIPKLELSGPGWRTNIQFDDRAAGYAKDGIPQDLFQDK